MHRSFLSPIDDYSNVAFRLLCQRYGAQATCVPLVNSTAISRNPEKAGLLMDAHLDERNIGVQLVGNRPEDIGRSVQVILERFPFVSWLNLNCGCPSIRTMNSGGGSALLKTPTTILESVGWMKKYSPVPVSVKIRIRENAEKTVELCRALEKAGVDFLILHGRTAAQGYSGEADWELIRQVRESVDIPLIGNGDLKNAAEGEARVAAGHCDGYMIARAAMGNPAVFADQQGLDANERAALLAEYFSLQRQYQGEPTVKDARIKATQFMAGVAGAAALRNLISRAATVVEIEGLVAQVGEGQLEAYGSCKSR